MVPEEVSVIVTSGPEVQRSLDSIRLQTQRPSETLLLDDPEHPVTRAWPGVTVVPRTGASRAAALNQGWTLARHELLAFADAWDVWPAERLAGQLAVMQGHPEIDMILGQAQPLAGRWAPAPSPGPHLGSALIRRSVFSRVGLFDEAYPMSDLEWLTRVRASGLNVVVREEVTLWTGSPPAGPGRCGPPGPLSISR
ncbi:MAG TPA: glycosyltransferase family A protein [Candidatus Xenobia bacterium]